MGRIPTWATCNGVNTEAPPTPSGSDYVQNAKARDMASFQKSCFRSA
jgi:hypothetical protein